MIDSRLHPASLAAPTQRLLQCFQLMESDSLASFSGCWVLEPLPLQAGRERTSSAAAAGAAAGAGGGAAGAVGTRAVLVQEGQPKGEGVLVVACS